jgi:hypothetical protein
MSCCCFLSLNTQRGTPLELGQIAEDSSCVECFQMDEHGNNTYIEPNTEKA